MKKLLLESIDNESRKGALAFLKNNFKRCFTLDQQDLSDDKKEKLCQEYVKKNEVEYCLTWDVGGCNWTKALIMAVVRILKTECNDETSRPANTRMKERLKKVHFAAMMYRQKQVWDGVPKEQILSKDANGMNFYRLSALVMPMYEELKEYPSEYKLRETLKTTLYELTFEEMFEERMTIKNQLFRFSFMIPESWKILDKTQFNKASTGSYTLYVIEAEKNNIMNVDILKDVSSDLLSEYTQFRDFIIKKGFFIASEGEIKVKNLKYIQMISQSKLLNEFLTNLGIEV